MRLSIWPNLQQPWSGVLDVARHADATGWDGLWVADHFMGDGSGFGALETPTLEATAAIPALLASTGRLRVGSLVLGATYRHPAVVANWAATVDHVAGESPGGRFVLGIGAGWQANEHEQYGIALPPVRERVDRFAAYCAVLDGLLRQERSSLDGPWFQLREAVCEPKPLQASLPVLIGGKGDRMLGVVARYADEWNMWGLPPLIASRSAVLDERCERLGRDPASVRRSAQALVRITDDEGEAARFVEAVAPRAAFAGPASRFAALVDEWSSVGVDEVIVPDQGLGHGDERREAMDAIAEAMRAPA